MIFTLSVPYFNPHFHKGSDAGRSSSTGRRRNFNPHFHKGSDKRFFGMARVNVISIHTSTREVTHLSYKECVKIYISIHTSTREVTFAGAQVVDNSLISIHTSTREVTHQHGRPYIHCRYFNPHFHKGSDWRKM